MKFCTGARFFILVILFCYQGIRLSAQTNSYRDNQFDNRILKLSFGAEIGIANRMSPFNYGLGFNLQAQYYLSDQLVITASGGYSRLLTKDTSPQPDYDFLPLFAGIKVFPIHQFYFLGDIGAGIPIQKGSKMSFIFAGGLGYEVSRNLDLSIKYIGYQQNKSSSTYQPTNGQFALRLGYNF